MSLYCGVTFPSPQLCGREPEKASCQHSDARLMDVTPGCHGHVSPSFCDCRHAPCAPHCSPDWLGICKDWGPPIPGAMLLTSKCLQAANLPCAQSPLNFRSLVQEPSCSPLCLWLRSINCLLMSQVNRRTCEASGFEQSTSVWKVLWKRPPSV